MSLFLATYLAATDYNCGSYGAGTYNEASCSTEQSPGDSGDSLADTGYDILLPVVIAGALILAALVLIIRKVSQRRNKS